MTSQSSATFPKLRPASERKLGPKLSEDQPSQRDLLFDEIKRAASGTVRSKNFRDGQSRKSRKFLAFIFKKRKFLHRGQIRLNRFPRKFLAYQKFLILTKVYQTDSLKPFLLLCVINVTLLMCSSDKQIN